MLRTNLNKTAVIPPDNATLLNPTQSSTKCYNDGSCYPAELAIDHNRTTSAITEDATPRPWWRASMSSMTVQQVR